MAAPAKTSADWAAVVRDLEKRRAADGEQTAKFRGEKQNLALEAAMGGAEAQKRLRAINGELARIELEAEDLAAAIASAEGERQKAAAREAEAVERKRLEKMGEFAAIALKSAAAFTAALREARRAAADIREATQGMNGIANRDELSAVNDLSHPQSYMRTAEHCGLAGFLGIQRYPGPQEHLQPLETVFAGLLERWLPKEKEKARHGS